jgi:hypothetical protein
MTEVDAAYALLNSFAMPKPVYREALGREDFALIGYLLVRGKATHGEVADILHLGWGDDPDRNASDFMPGISRRGQFANYVAKMIMPKGYLTLTEESPRGSGDCFWTLRPSFIEKCIEAFDDIGPVDDE